jgi:hypothetical protein
VDGNASSAEGNDADEEGNGSAGAEGNDCGKAGNGSADVEDCASDEEAGGSANDGKTSGSIDTCACAARTTAKKIPATRAGVDRSASGRGISPAVSVAVRSGNAAKRWIVWAKPGRMAARLEWGHRHVNQKISLKISQKKPRFPTPRVVLDAWELTGISRGKLALRFFA